MQRRTRLNTILKLSYTQHFSFVKDVLDLQSSGYFLLQLKKGSNNAKKIRTLSKEEIKQQLIDSIINNGKVEREEELNEKADKVEKIEDAANIIKQYEEIIRTKKKNIVCIGYHQGKVFRRFKEKKKFIKLLKVFKVHETTMIFKINIIKLIDEDPKLMKSSVTLGFLKNNYKDIKQICKENPNEFQYVKVICFRENSQS